MVVPFAAGGPVDTIGRILGARLSDILGQQVVIENIGGAGGMIGASRVAKAEPDGYVFLLGTNSVFAFNQTIYKKPLYDTVADFAPVTLFANSARILITRKDFPASSLAEFNAYAKSNQAKMQYGSAGRGSGAHVCAALLDATNGTKIAHVPYRGTAQAMQDLIGGRLDFVLRADLDRRVTDRGRDRQSHRSARSGPRARAPQPADRQGAWLRRSRLQLLVRLDAAEGHAGCDHPAARPRHQRGGRDRIGARAAGAGRRHDPRG